MTSPTLRYGDKHPLGAAYPVEQEAFAGPLALLLSLIERQQLDISAISLVAVTDSYLTSIEALSDVAPDALAEFLALASRLIFIKSRALLPKPPSDSDGEEESADALVRQLLAYRQFKRAAAELAARDEQGLRAYVRTASVLKPERRLDLSNVDLARLQAALQRALRRIPSEPPPPRVRAYAVTVAQRMDEVRATLRRVLATGAPVHFDALLEHAATRVEIIVTFLAVLELIKQRELAVEQEETFGEIVLRGRNEENGER